MVWGCVITSLAYNSYPNFPIPLPKKLSYSPCIFLPTLSKINLLCMCGFISGLSILSIDLFFCFVPILCYFDHWFNCILLCGLVVLSAILEGYAFCFILSSSMFWKSLRRIRISSYFYICLLGSFLFFLVSLAGHEICQFC